MIETTLNLNGLEIPRIGLGTYELQGQRCRDAVAAALAAGYRHIDTAAEYGNEQEIGDALQASAVPRDRVFVTSKVWWDQLTREGVAISAAESLRRLRTDTLDLLLVHWPNSEVPLEDTLGAMKDLQAAGLIRAFGVSNFPSPLLHDACEQAAVACNQVEYHPFLSQRRLLTLAQSLGVVVTAYSPLAQGRVFGNATLQRIAAAHGCSVAQVVLRWLIQQPGVAAVPRSGDPAHIQANLNVFDLRLTAEDLQDIDALARGQRLVDPDFAPDWTASAAEVVGNPMPEAYRG